MVLSYDDLPSESPAEHSRFLATLEQKQERSIAHRVVEAWVSILHTRNSGQGTCGNCARIRRVFDGRQSKCTLTFEQSSMAYHRSGVRMTSRRSRHTAFRHQLVLWIHRRLLARAIDYALDCGPPRLVTHPIRLVKTSPETCD